MGIIQEIEAATHKTDVYVFQDITLAMLIVCLLGIGVAIAFGNAMAGQDINSAKHKLYGVGHYFVPTRNNIIYHVFAGLLTLTFIKEVGFGIIKTWVEIPTEIEAIGDMFFSAMSGLLGGYIIARIIIFTSKKLNKNAN